MKQKLVKILMGITVSGLLITAPGAEIVPHLYAFAEEEMLDEEISDEEQALEAVVAAQEAAVESEAQNNKDTLSEAGGELIEDTHPTSAGSLPDGLAIADQIRDEQEGTSMITVNPALYPAANISENTKEVYWYCRLVLGLNHAAACGVLGNVQMESNFRPIAIGDGGTSYGICQWHLGRYTSLTAYCRGRGLDHNTLEGQLSYLRYELTGGYRGCYEQLLSVPDTAEGAAYAGWVMCVMFEMPDQMDARGHQRGNLARDNFYPQDFTETASFRVTEESPVYSSMPGKEASKYDAVNVGVLALAEMPALEQGEKALVGDLEGNEGAASEMILSKEYEAAVKYLLAEDEIVRIISISNGWAKITSPEGPGFVSCASLEHIKESEMKVVAEDETEDSAEDETEEPVEDETEIENEEKLESAAGEDADREETVFEAEDDTEIE